MTNYSILNKESTNSNGKNDIPIFNQLLIGYKKYKFYRVKTDGNCYVGMNLISLIIKNSSNKRSSYDTILKRKLLPLNPYIHYKNRRLLLTPFLCSHPHTFDYSQHFKSKLCNKYLIFFYCGMVTFSIYHTINGYITAAVICSPRAEKNHTSSLENKI